MLATVELAGEGVSPTLSDRNQIQHTADVGEAIIVFGSLENEAEVTALQSVSQSST